MLRTSFIPSAEIRRLRDYTRLRSDLVGERTRYAQRLEKLLEDTLIKLSTVASNILGVSGRAMLEALIAGERDPQALADLACRRMRAKHAALVEALTGCGIVGPARGDIQLAPPYASSSAIRGSPIASRRSTLSCPRWSRRTRRSSATGPRARDREALPRTQGRHTQGAPCVSAGILRRKLRAWIATFA